MSVTAKWVPAAVIAMALIAGCGGSDEPETVNGCVIEPGTSCPSADLSGADLEGADLSQAILTSANLEGTNLSGADLTQADLSAAQIVDADLSDADLTRANLANATIAGTNLDGATLCGTTRIDGTVDDTSCPVPSDTTEATDTTTPAAAEVTSFEVGDLSCGAATTAPVTVAWATANATAVEIAVDSVSPTGLGPSGSTIVLVPCDDESHTITITPQSDSEPGEPESKDVSSD